MKKNIYLISIIWMVCILSGCSLFHTHKVDIDQGNIITTENVHALQPGMTEHQVKEIMGTPVLVNIFSPNRIDYVYTFQAGHGGRTENNLTCIFQHGRLKEVQKS